MKPIASVDVGCQVQDIRIFPYCLSIVRECLKVKCWAYVR